ncbi:MAG: hypothetical protein H0X29_02950 [Parachlamydiaceae bacterium]|nr:hypothetical protein [Parachlamydiaceae bacterium]
MSKLQFAHTHKDILQPIEATAVLLYKQGKINHDHVLIRIYDALYAYYRAINTNFPIPTPKFNTSLELSLYESIKEISQNHKPKTMLDCIMVLRKSAHLWNKEHGSRGYLNYISQFM